MRLSLSPLVLVVVSALLHALWNALLKRETKDQASTTSVLLIAATSALGIAAFERVTAFPEPRAIVFAVVAGLAEATYFHCLARSLAGAPLGFAYPLARGGSILVVWPVSIWILLESVSGPRIVGGAIVLLGLLAVAGAHRPTRRSALFIGGAALSIAGYHLAYKLALDRHAAPMALFATSLGVALAAHVAVFRNLRAGILAIARRPLSLGGAGILCTVSFLMFLEALRQEGAGLVLTLRNTSVLFSQIFAFGLGERPTRNQLIGCVLIAGGGALIAWR